MATNTPRNAFTLIELLVVLVIVSVLASLSLAGLAGARQRAKIDKTRSTIRKIDSVIRPIFDSYLTPRQRPCRQIQVPRLGAMLALSNP